MINVGRFAAQISIDRATHSLFKQTGFSLNVGVDKFELLCNESIELEVVFDPRVARSEAGPVEITLLLKVRLFL